MLNEDLRAALRAAVTAAEPNAYAAYAAIHQQPELALQEYNTNKLIRQRVS